MNYEQIKSLVLSYADREDTEVSDRIDNFILIVESITNRFLRMREASSRVTLVTSEQQEYYGLPDDFNGLRDIEIRDTLSSTKRTTLKYLSPEQQNNITEENCVYYTLIGNQLQIRPAQDNKILEITYFQKVPNLATETSNWLSESYPDAYVFGLMVEISAFVKDSEAGTLWEARFKEVLNSIDNTNTRNNWSGTALEVRVG